MSYSLYTLGLAGLLFASVSFGQAQSALTVSVEGAVLHAGQASYPADSRLATVGLAAVVQPDAYILGAAWLQPELQEDQLRLKAGLLYELSAIWQKASAKNTKSYQALADDSHAMRVWLSGRPVTGRHTQVNLDPYRLDITPLENLPVRDGDRLIYPRRPVLVNIVGAVHHVCGVPHVPLQDARRYLASCPVSSAADPHSIFVVQPDGQVIEQNVALWDRSAPLVLAPGAWIYVPLNHRAIAGAADDDFNRDFARFLATQPVSDGETK